jgi:hypothetical protein
LDDRRWTGASRDCKQREPGLSQMDEKSLLGIAFLRMIFGFARTGGQFAFNRVNFNQMNKEK